MLENLNMNGRNSGDARTVINVVHGSLMYHKEGAASHFILSPCNYWAVA